MRLIECSIETYMHQLSQLIQPHWEELATNKGLMQLRPDWHKYRALEDAGKIRMVYAVDHNDGYDKVIGYSCNIIDYHLHYSGLKVMSNDVLFVAPDHRGTAGLRLMKETERIARRDGAELMLWHAKQGSSLDLLLKAKNLPVQDILYSKVL